MRTHVSDPAPGLSHRAGAQRNPMIDARRFAERTFRWAGVYGIAVLLPQYFAEGGGGARSLPPLTHPAHFYGFIGVALAWQVVFLVISRDVARFRPLMLAAVIEKLAFGLPTLGLLLAGRADAVIAAFAGIDLVLSALFVTSWRLSARLPECHTVVRSTG